MKKTEEYKQRAQECRDLAKRTGPGHERDQLLEMAETWDRLSEERTRKREQSIDTSRSDGDDCRG